MSAFADTSSLYAAMVRSEASHAECLAVFEHLLAGGRTIQTTSYLALETATLLQHRIGLDPVRDFEEQVLPLIRVTWVSKDLVLSCVNNR